MRDGWNQVDGEDLCVSPLRDDSTTVKSLRYIFPHEPRNQLLCAAVVRSFNLPWAWASRLRGFLLFGGMAADVWSCPRRNPLDLRARGSLRPQLPVWFESQCCRGAKDFPVCLARPIILSRAYEAQSPLKNFENTRPPSCLIPGCCHPKQ